jgi:hypothetical protein
MKTLITLILTITGMAAMAAAEPLFKAGDIVLSPFGSYRVKEFDGNMDRFGAGTALTIGVARNIAVEANFLSEGLHWKDASFADSFTEAGANLKGYLPVGRIGLAPYGLIGYTRDLRRDENRMNAGAGLEVRAKRAVVFADGQWTHDFERVGQALFRIGLGLKF